VGEPLALRGDGHRHWTMVKRLSLAVAILGWSGVCFAQTPPATSGAAAPMQSATTSSNDHSPQHLPGSTIAACRTSFPPMVFKQGEHPQTTLTFTIGLEGGVKNVVVGKPSGYDQLDSAAVACVSTWRYMPATKNGQAVEVPQTLTIPWTTSDRF
jgi:TonB family protein